MKSDCMFANPGAFTGFEKLRPDEALYFNRCHHPSVGFIWFGPWKTLYFAEGTAEVAADWKRIMTHYRVKVSKMKRE